ncbi:LPS assembly lipoprotein LptE [Marilutibacter aestuarii]|uniref:LPS-assembly lipoprotein LptE n=1 Tax=Marilutibacter aestuarii TaxID=1706195 RepID=A0A508A0E2_9GAMM|nr:LPS assembly lipoprotein LptE [Lysobacter aestuarii]TQD43500.1 hypothetical protein FKV25_10365 [Lysobacter aestuarii]
MTLRLLVVVLVLALPACGFHLRDALVLPPDLGPVRVVSADRYSPLAESLSRSIERAGAELALPDQTDTAVLDLVAERWGDTPISVDAFGRAQEYSLRYATIFEVRSADGTVLVPRQAVELSRDYISVPTNSVGTEGERDILVKELRREMSASILRRIDAVARREPGALMGEAPTAAEGGDAPGDAAPSPAATPVAEPTPSAESGDEGG